MAGQRQDVDAERCALAGLSCPLGQGYRFGRPRPAHDAVRLTDALTDALTDTLTDTAP